MVQRAERTSSVTAPAGPPGWIGRLLAGSGAIAAAMAVTNVATYGFSMLALRIIGTIDYGAFFAMMNLLLIVSVVSLGLQATAARRISADPAHVQQIEREVLRAAYRAALLLGLLLVVLSPLINRVLDLDSLPMALLAAAAAVPMTLMGAQAGILQGERRWRPLALLYVCGGVPRLVIGLGLILWQPTGFAALLGVTVGFAAPYLYGLYALRHDRTPGAASETHESGAIIREALVNSQALLAFFALTNADMLVGRTVLDAHDSGLYAAGLIVARAVLFLPQFVVIIAFPSMSTATERTRALTRSLALVGGLGVACTLATFLLPDLALLFAGGSGSAEVRSELWLFALLGTLMSCLQLLVYSVLARQGRTSVYIVWAALVAMVLGGLTTSSVAGLLTVVLVTDGALLVVLLAVSWLILKRDAQAPVEPAEAPPVLPQ